MPFKKKYYLITLEKKKQEKIVWVNKVKALFEKRKKKVKAVNEEARFNRLNLLNLGFPVGFQSDMKMEAVE